MPTDKYSLFLSSSSFFEFDSLKLAAVLNSFKTDFERIQFLENLKIEFDIASDFCKSHIAAIKRCKKYLIEFEFKNNPYSDEKSSVELSLKNIFTTSSSWQTYFYSENDFISFTTTLNNFFSGSKYDSLNNISINKGNATKFSSLLHDIYFSCSSFKCLKKDKKFLLLLKTLPIYANLNIDTIYYKLTHY